ncbi:putative sterigmatocystin biosynthesis monooxygenase stcW [Cyphellophora attinorum]|uniref:Putative sterigmatocystin biosynthesis monooxygenase stcW n=1 Tax=Cyphellophora attinorum TaxID=1664694 RepID=A0A0N1P3H8_9EURO|nr:putative sterigmatocystin biosynthesis monooxygenase stcW [Phialophora attinorum]KPI45430.1 putative sterigmatocystin biosynthesis monooxygenase stcW [Phialophora attinorum]
MTVMNGTGSLPGAHALDNARPLKVIVIGAGISGILNGIKLPRAVQNLDLVIYDKNEGLGGTWLENRYPGVACDIPSHAYQLSWDFNHAWSTFYASGSEILRYWQRVAEKYNVLKYMRFSHKVLKASWDDATAKWRVIVQDTDNGGQKTDEADVLISAVGILNQWDWPSIPGLQDFKGKLMHSAAWDPNFQIEDKVVAVIGAGSSGIQIVPNIRPKVRQLHHYVRGRTWIATPMGLDQIIKRGVEGENFDYEADEIKGWQDNRESYLDYRKAIEKSVQSGSQVVLRGSEVQAMARQIFSDLMAKRLSKKPELLQHFLPSFSPLCKRITPGPGYLEALTEDNVEVIVDPIERVNETGIVTKCGKQRDVDAIICATGFNTHFDSLPIYGRTGAQLFAENAAGPRTANYLGLAVNDFANMFMLLGPNSGLGHGNLLITIERFVDYTAQALQKMQLENIRTMQPSVRSVKNFTAFCDTYFQRTVYSEECSSWYKTDGRITGLWPGSSLHAVKALEKPRWEDWEYTYHDDDEMGWLGDGSARADWDADADKGYYLTSLEGITDDRLM